MFFRQWLSIRSGKKNHLVGLLMIDGPPPADHEWLQAVNGTYGECHLVPKTEAGERGLVCQMQIDSDSLPHLWQFPTDMSDDIKTALDPLLEESLAPFLKLDWDEETHLWHSEFATPNELIPEIREAFENLGYGSLAVETNVGIVHICRASDKDIEGFEDKPVNYQW